MNRILAVLLLLLSLNTYAQEEFQVLDQYKYLIVNTSMYEGARDPYDASTYLRQKLFGLKYRVVAENEISWPEELADNKCLGLWVNVVTIPKAFGDYQVALDFYNCQNITVLELNGKGDGANSSEAFHRAIDRSLRDFKSYPYVFKPELALLPPKGRSVEVDSLILYLKGGELEPLEGLYGFNSGMYNYEMGIKKQDKEYIGYVITSDMSTWKGGEVKGRFNKSNRPGLFSVKWFLDDKVEYDTFGYINEDESLTIEFKRPGDEYQPLTIK
ncbi:MAG: hypothetical protein RIF33_12110, partial [Cyclobacteriaceae bacterium]